ncbi:hypothetical protein Fleli_2829 [Bernardetia litoralis DSM 6794]|uniref:Uncharacterized protein n=1 Tax=Bernardetia litoralis (strain ATCC 23117 / DSM 6794 / NBRC 15988 / NCIMB 1366 / Fx l1 / Sio-4) TaxID=880071 RepID=I4AMJ7_BERLS|nr:hypothetical protein [Bernardetia litoralis]AFM05182.1 hypothetical protein Fleli_2829 [Bernardetia litoralis DSM 6794]
MKNDISTLVYSQDFIFEFLPHNSECKEVEIPTDLYEDTQMMLENVLWMSDKVDTHITDSDDFSSWVLARLWYLFKPNFDKSLNVFPTENNQYVGGQDSGSYIADGIIMNLDKNLIGNFYVCASSDYPDIRITDFAFGFSVKEALKQLSDLIWSEPNKISKCHIIIKDPEQNSKKFHYGWDGEKFFYTPYK